MRSTVALVFASLATAGACSGGSRGGSDTAVSTNAAMPATSNGVVAAASGTVPASIEAIGHHGENAYDMVKAGDWVGARASADSLRPASDSVPAAASIAIRELNQAITAKDRVAALRASNHLTELGALLSESYHPQVPPEVTLLDYYGRELEIAAATGDRDRLREIAVSMRRTWNTVRPQVEAHGGRSEAAKFDALIAQVEAARTPADYAKVATPVLDAVDTLEQVFTR